MKNKGTLIDLLVKDKEGEVNFRAKATKFSISQLQNSLRKKIKDEHPIHAILKKMKGVKLAQGENEHCVKNKIFCEFLSS